MSVDTEKLLVSGFTPDQVNEIKEGMEEGLDTSVYAKKDFLAIQMRQIRLGMREGLPVEKYANAEYDWFQMEEIREGLQAGVDISVYASPNISYDRMRQLRKGLLQGINLAPYAKRDAGVLRQLRKALAAKVNIIEYIKQGYETEQLEQIRRALLKGVDISPYLSKEFRGVSIREIRKGLESGLDVSTYAKIGYSWQQMRELRFGLANRLDISQYNSMYYSWEQMRQIRLGLEEGLDVSFYRSLMFTAKEMKERRKRLQNCRIVEIKKDVSEKGHYKHFGLAISRDEMEVWLEFHGNVRQLDRGEIDQALAESGVKAGIREDVIRDLTNGINYHQSVLIARGKQPRKGKDGWYEYFFRTNPDRKPKQLPDGSVDYQNIEWFELVKTGQKLAYYHEAEKGTDGVTVTGRILHGQNGHEQRVLSGKGFRVLEDQKTYLAAMDGRIELIKNRIEITNILQLLEMTQTSGRVDFDGSVYVRGNVGSGAYIRATGDVLVDGFVESATIESGGNIVLRQGANASGYGFLKAGKNVSGKFFEAIRVYAEGDIQANYSLNCELHAGGRITISGTKGTLAGGTVFAVDGIRAHNVGNRAGIVTMLNLGSNDIILQEQKKLEDEMKEVNKELSMLGNGYLEMQRKYAPEIRNTMEIYIKLENAIYTKEKQMEKLLSDQKNLEEKIKRMEQVKAVIEGVLYEGAVISVNGLIWRASENRNVTVKRAGSEIMVYPNR